MRRARENGFTMVEVTIVVAILALVAGIVLPSVSNVSRAELRASASKLAALVRRTYQDASLSGQTHRLVFDLSSRKIGVEASEHPLNLEPGSNALAEAVRPDDDLSDLMTIPSDLLDQLQETESESEDENDEDPEASGGTLNAMLQLNDFASTDAPTPGSAFAAPEATGLKLGDDVRLLDVWVQGMEEPLAEGVAYLYFFAHGYTQDAMVHLEDEGGRVFTVQVQALTGQTKIAGEYVEIPK